MQVAYKPTKRADRKKGIKKMKKILVALMCLTVAVSFSSCKKKTTDEKMQNDAAAMQKEAATMQKEAEKAGKDLQKDADKAKKDAVKKLDKLTK
jgi:hypothetical protein